MNQGDAIPRLIRLADFAKAISVSVRELYRMIDEKQVPAPIKQGRRSFFFREDLDSYFEQLKKQRK
jgi:predicted DNA-binding transcriptional regulator AlpA